MSCITSRSENFNIYPIILTNIFQLILIYFDRIENGYSFLLVTEASKKLR